MSLWCMEASNKTLLLDENVINAAVANIAQAVISEFSPEISSSLVFIGIHKRGVMFAKRLVKAIADKTGTAPHLGTLDITMYRDDIGRRKTLPQIYPTELPFNINDQIIILADDVLQTGRTIRAALDALTDYGRPSLIRLAVLVDRGMREFPIRADYSGKLFQIPREKKIIVKWKELDDEDAVYVSDRVVSQAVPEQTQQTDNAVKQ